MGIIDTFFGQYSKGKVIFPTTPPVVSSVEISPSSILDPQTGAIKKVDQRILKVKENMDRLFVFINAQPDRYKKKEYIEFDKEFFFDRQYVENLMGRMQRVLVYHLKSDEMKKLNDIWKKYKFEVPAPIPKEEPKPELEPEKKSSSFSPIS